MNNRNSIKLTDEEIEKYILDYVNTRQKNAFSLYGLTQHEAYTSALKNLKHNPLVWDSCRSQDNLEVICHLMAYGHNSHTKSLFDFYSHLTSAILHKHPNLSLYDSMHIDTLGLFQQFEDLLYFIQIYSYNQLCGIEEAFEIALQETGKQYPETNTQSLKNSFTSLFEKNLSNIDLQFYFLARHLKENSTLIHEHACDPDFERALYFLASELKDNEFMAMFDDVMKHAPENKRFITLMNLLTESPHIRPLTHQQLDYLVSQIKKASPSEIQKDQLNHLTRRIPDIDCTKKFDRNVVLRNRSIHDLQQAVAQFNNPKHCAIDINIELKIAIQNQQLNDIAYYLHLGADPNQKNSEGEFLLHEAVKKQQITTVILLLNAGANPLEKNDEGKNASAITNNKPMLSILQVYSLTSNKELPLPSVKNVIPFSIHQSPQQNLKLNNQEEHYTPKPPV